MLYIFCSHLFLLCFVAAKQNSINTTLFITNMPKKIFRIKDVLREVKKLDIKECENNEDHANKKNHLDTIELIELFKKFDEHLDRFFDADSSLSDIPDYTKDDLHLLVKTDINERKRSRSV